MDAQIQGYAWIDDAVIQQDVFNIVVIKGSKYARIGLVSAYSNTPALFEKS